MKKKKPTLRDIAEKAQVSIGTVDRAIHNRGRISPEVRERVLAIAKDIGYQKNIYASLLASKNKAIHLSFLVPYEGKDDYWDMVIKGINNAIDNSPVENLQFNKIEFDLFDSNDFLRAINEIDKSKTEVLLTAPIFRKEWLILEKKLAKEKIPYVIINTYPKILESYNICYIGPDSYQSGKLAGRLMNHHCLPGDKVLFMPLEIDYVNASHMVEKKDGFQEFFALHAQGVEVVVSDFEEFNNKKGVKRYLRQILEQYPTIRGIYVSASRTHIIADAIEGMDKKPILIGYDTLPENIRHLKNENIHYLINQNPTLMGFLGMKMCQKYAIYRTIDQKKILMPLDIIVPENYKGVEAENFSYSSELLNMNR